MAEVLQMLGGAEQLGMVILEIPIPLNKGRYLKLYGPGALI